MRWLQMRDILEHKLDVAQSQADSFERNVADSLLFEYYNVLKGTSVAAGVSEKLWELNPNEIRDEFEAFRGQVAGVAAELLMSQTYAPSDAIRISAPVRERIVEQTIILREIVESAELEDEKKSALFALLDKFDNELGKTTLDRNKVFKIMGAIAVGVTIGTSFLADAPVALTTIQQLIGLQEQAEAEKTKLLQAPDEPAIPQLPAPLKQLPSPSTTQTTNI